MVQRFFTKNEQLAFKPEFKLKNGETPLHQILRSDATITEIKNFIETQGREKCSLMAKMQDDTGKLPIELITNDEELVGLLKPLTICSNLKPLSEPNNIPDLKEYRIDETLNDNLNLGRYISFKARSTIKRSPAHDMVRGLPHYEVDKMAREMNEMRRAMLREHQDALGFKPDLSSIKNQELSLQIVSHYPQSYGIGNCYEFCFVALKELRNQGDQSFAQILEIKSNKGAHNVLCFGHKPEDSIEDLLKRKSNAVICDPWAGEVYPSFLIPKLLKTYAIIELNDGQDYIATAPFYNARVNTIKSEFSCETPKPVSDLGRSIK